MHSTCIVSFHDLFVLNSQSLTFSRDDSVSKYIPEVAYPLVCGNMIVTIRQLMSHMAMTGLPETAQGTGHTISQVLVFPPIITCLSLLSIHFSLL